MTSLWAPATIRDDGKNGVPGHPVTWPGSLTGKRPCLLSPPHPQPSDVPILAQGQVMAKASTGTRAGLGALKSNWGGLPFCHTSSFLPPEMGTRETVTSQPLRSLKPGPSVVSVTPQYWGPQSVRSIRWSSSPLHILKIHKRKEMRIHPCPGATRTKNHRLGA